MGSKGEKVTDQETCEESPVAGIDHDNVPSRTYNMNLKGVGTRYRKQYRRSGA